MRLASTIDQICFIALPLVFTLYLATEFATHGNAIEAIWPSTVSTNDPKFFAAPVTTFTADPEPVAEAEGN